MSLDLQFKIKSNPLYINYLHENSYWYKALNRNPKDFNKFVSAVKEYYKLRPADKLNKMMSTFEIISNLITSLNS